MSRADENAPTLEAQEEAQVLGLLEAALRPGELDPARLERLIEAALEDPLAPPTEAEAREAARLREALDRGHDHADAAVLTALQSAFQPAFPDPELLERAQRQLPGAAPRVSPRPNVIYATFGAVGVALALAASFMLVFGARQFSPAREAPELALAKARSTTPLFTERFETADTSARIDRIASARSRDLRGNRYAAWGVQ